MMQIIPLQAVPNQQLNIQLANQLCQINVYQKLQGLFLDLYISGILIIGGVLCEDRNRIVRNTYLGFTGDLAFIDTQGTSDPVYTGFGGRYALAYLEAADLSQITSLD